MKRLLLGFIALLIPGCSLDPKEKLGNIPEIYNKAIQDHGPHQNPVIVIPGVLGSQLRRIESRELVWADSLNKTANPSRPEGCRKLAIPMEIGKPLSALNNSLEAFAVLDRLKIKIGFLPVEKAAYINILKTLGVGGYFDESLMKGQIDYGEDHFTCFQFPYDWRRSCAENAQELGKFIDEKRVTVREGLIRRYGHAPKRIKFDIVAHSMGGMVARYYMRYGDQPLGTSGPLPVLNWAGAEDLDKVVLVGTPSGGSMKSFSQLAYGFQMIPLGKRYFFRAGLIGTMPGSYELLPRVRHRVITDSVTDKPLELLDPEMWRSRKLGIFSDEEQEVVEWLLPDKTPEERRAFVFDHVRKCLNNAERFQRAMDRRSEHPSSIRLSLFAGTSVETDFKAQYFPEEKKRVLITKKTPGDEAVALYSALMDERVGQGKNAQTRLDSPIRWRKVMLLPRDHLGLTQDPVFVNNVLFTLFEE